MPDPKFRLGLAQMRCGTDAAENLDRATTMIRDLAKRDAQVIVLPELFLGPYFCKVHDMDLFDLAEPIPGPSTEVLSKLAKELGVVIVASIFERRSAGCNFNTCPVFDADGKMLGIYRKMHIPHDPLYYEKYYFRQGDLGFKMFRTKFANIGTLVCWDQWFPEAARMTAMLGAEVLTYPTAIGWHPKEKAEVGESQYDAWRTVQRGHAIGNGVYVAATNRVGFEPSDNGGIEFWGGSFVADPFGVILHQASHVEEELIVVECDRARMTDVRRNWPFFRDRRTDAYGAIVESGGE